MKTSELIGAALDWAVAKCDDTLGDSDIHPYSTDWSQGGPIIEREKIRLRFEEEYPYLSVPPMSTWVANYENVWGQAGPTPLIAAMRCYVASKLGDTIKIPEELK